MKETFDRRDRLAGDNVTSLEKRITNAELKIQNYQNRPDVATKTDQISKLEEQIVKVIFSRVKIVNSYRIEKQFDNC
jgi:Sorting nexin 8/Mvp1 BAR domain